MEYSKWTEWVFSGIGVAAVGTLGRFIWSRLSGQRSKSLAAAHGRAPRTEFPYDLVAPADLPDRIHHISHDDIPYFQRIADPNYRQLLDSMDSAHHLLIVGRTGIGKTREALEHIQRFARQTTDETVVLLPQGAVDIPDNLPFDGLKRNVLLFVDNLPGRYRSGTVSGESSEPQGDVRQQFKQIIKYFEDTLGTHFRVIATAIGTPDFRERLCLEDDPFWKTFTIVALPELALERREDFLALLEHHFGVSITPEARELLILRSDGTFSGMLTGLLRNRGKGMIQAADLADFSGVYPQDWDRTVYLKEIDPHPYRRCIFQALSVLKTTNMEPLVPLVVDLATRLSSDEAAWWHRRRTKHALKELSDWAPVVDGYVRCPNAYLEGKAELSTCVSVVVESIDWFLKSSDYRLLRPSLHNLVNALLDMQDIRNALLVIDRLLLVNPDNVHAWLRKALISARNGDFRSAVCACEESLKLSRSWQVWSTWASVLQLQLLFAESIQPLRNSLQRNKWNAATWVNLARAYERTNQLGRAIGALRQAERLDYANAQVHGTLGVLYEKLGRFELAIRELKYAAAVDPNSHVPLQTLAVMYVRLRRINEAIVVAEKAKSIAPESADVWHILARVYEAANRFKDAVQAFERAMKLRPGDWGIALSYGVALGLVLSGQDLIQALTEISEVPGMDFGTSEVSEGHGMGLGAFGLKENPSRLRLMDAVAMVLRKKGDFAKAEMLTSAAIKLSTKPSQYHLSLALALRKSGQLDRAEQELRTALQLNPDYSMAWSHLSRVLREQASTSERDVASRKLAEAVAASRCSINLAPGFVRNRLGLALVLIAVGELAHAEIEIREAIPLTSKRQELAELYAALAAVLRKLGDVQEAKQVLTTAEGFHPGAAEKYYAIAFGSASSSSED